MSEQTPSAIFAYIAGDDRSDVALLKAQLEHMGGALSRELSLNAEAERTISRLTAENEGLRTDLGRVQSTLDCMESNARVQAKLLADTGRERDALRKALELIESFNGKTIYNHDAEYRAGAHAAYNQLADIAISALARGILATPADSDAIAAPDRNGTNEAR